MSGDERPALLRRFDSDLVRFIFVGISNVLVGYAVFLSALHLLGTHPLRGTLAQAIAYAVGTVWSYYWNRRWTFRSTAAVGAEAQRFILLQVICAILSTGSIGLAVDVWQLNPSLSWILVTGWVSVLNYVLSKRWVFVSDEADGEKP